MNYVTNLYVSMSEPSLWQGVEPEAMAVDQYGEPIKGLSDMWSAGVVWSLS